MTQRIKGLAAVVLIGVLMVGVPTALTWAGTGFFPTSLSSPPRIWEALSKPDDGTLVMGVLLVAGWLAWAYLMVGILAEIWAAIRRIQAPKLPGFSLPQGVARKLVGVAMLAVATVPALAGTSHANPQPGGAPAARPGVSITPTSIPTVISHQVGPGDTLFKIAHRYWGDGWLYPTLFEANRNIVQSNGRPLDNPDLITDGTVLSVPTVPPTGPNTIQHTVGADDTVAVIARKVLGSETRSSEIQTLLKDGSLKPGDVLTIPVSAPDTTRQTTVEVPPQEQGIPELVAATPGPIDSSVSAERTVHPSADDGAKELDSGSTQTQSLDETREPTLVDQISSAATSFAGIEDGWPSRTTFGVGAVLAGGLVSLISVRRGLQRRRRTRGVEMLMPSGVAARMEHELRAVGDPLAISDVAKALRSVAAHCAAQGSRPPQIRVARLLGEVFEIYLVEPARLPSPWVGTSNQLMWTYQGQESEDVTVSEIPAPYPALVTIGQDEEGAHLLLDLEQVGELRVVGPNDLTREVLAALAIELATSSWADDLTVTVVGGFATMEDVLQTGRIRYLPTVGRLIEALANRAASDREALTQSDLEGVHHARVVGREPDTWYPEIILLLSPLTEGQQAQLNQLLDTNPRVAVALVQPQEQPGEWVLELTSPTSGIVQPLNLAVIPQRIDTAAYDQILDIVDTTTRQLEHNTMGPAVVAMLEEARALIDQPHVNQSEEESAGAPEQELLEETAVIPPGPEIPDESVAVPRVGPRENQPYLRLLGPVEVLNAPGPVEQSRRARLTEYVAYLMLTQTITPEGIDEAIWPNQNASMVRDPATSRIRKWLGTTEGDTPRLEPRTYRINDVGCDWSDFRSLTRGDLGRVPTQCLEAAVGLVTGAPFNRCIGRNWAWAETHQQQMITRIADTCHELATRQLLAGKYLDCETTLIVGLGIEPEDEQLWRMRILAAHARHDSQAVTEAMNRLYAQLGPLGSLEPETEKFLAAVKDHTPITELMEML